MRARPVGRNKAATVLAEGAISSVGGSFAHARRAFVRAIAQLPRPARLLWIFLALLGGGASVLALHGNGIAPLLLLPSFAAATDVVIQMRRFREIRMPDAAIATGLLVALLLPPSVSPFQAGIATVTAVVLRHVLRYRERPLLNPAAVGVLLGALFFWMAPAWWGSIEFGLVIVLGIVLTLRTQGSWRVPLGFLLTYAVLSVLGNVLLGHVTATRVLLLCAFDPSIVFFGFFMVPEPRASPTERTERLFFAALIGFMTALLPVVIPSLAPFVALLLGNLAAAVLRPPSAEDMRSLKAARHRSARRGRRKRPVPRASRSHSLDAWHEWRVGYRLAAGFLIVVLVGAVALALNAPTSTPFAAVRPSTPTGIAASGCIYDNPNIPSDLASFLHDRLGPSVLLSADANAGTVVFYDPVNKATVTETDMYEDFGYAEFNGDDYVVMGCSA